MPLDEIDQKLAALDATTAAQAFTALGSESRIDVLRQLVRAGPAGLTVGALQERLGVPASTLSHHLKFLAAAGLLEQERQGRQIHCRAQFHRIEALAAFLTRECCRDADAGARSDAPGADEERSA